MASYYQFRDSVTGRYTSKGTYNRSRGQGGTRYHREKRETKEKEKPSPITPQTIEEWEEAFEEAEAEDYDFVTEEAESGGDY
jgi:hypothetical protein